jgi:hypothetical protein
VLVGAERSRDYGVRAGRGLLALIAMLAGTAAFAPGAAAETSQLKCPASVGALRLAYSMGPEEAQGYRTLECRFGSSYDQGDTYLLVGWYVSGDMVRPGLCGTPEETSDVPSTNGGPTLASKTHRAFVLIGELLLTEKAATAAGARAAASTLLAQAESEAQLCPDPTGATADITPALPVVTNPGPTTTPNGNSGWNPIKALAAAGGVGLLGGSAAAAVRIRRRPRTSPTAVPTSQIVVDGSDAISILRHQGWLEPVTRPDGSVGWKPKGDLDQFVSFDHGAWQPAFISGLATSGGAHVGNLVGLAFTPGADGLIDSVTFVASVAPPAGPMPSPLAPAATSPTTGTGPDPGSRMLLDPSGGFTGTATSDFDTIMEPLVTHGRVRVPLASGLTPSPVHSAPAPAALVHAVPPPAAGPFGALLNPAGGSLAIGGADLPHVAPGWIAADGTISHGPFAGMHPVVNFGDGNIELRVPPYHATAQLHARGGRIVVDEPSVKGPLADFLDTGDIRAQAQKFLDASLNNPLAARGLHVNGAQINAGGIHITTAPVGQ